MRKPLFVRHCGNWFVQSTTAEHFWKWFMEHFAGGRNVMVATGGAAEAPSIRNPNLGWIFSTSLTEAELQKASQCGTKPLNANVRLIIICRQEHGKGTDIVIRSLPSIVEKFPLTKLDVVGDGDALQDFKDLAKSLGLDEQVTFHGKVNHEQVLSLLRQANVFCYPTDSEGFPKVVLEALAQGVPVITTPVSVLPMLIGTGSGVLLKDVTPQGLAQAVVEVLSDNGRYSTMSKQAMSIAGQYSLERWRDSIGELLRTAWGRQLRSDV